MNVTNCTRCGKVFMKVRSPLCPDCQREEEELAQEVISYIKQHPDASLAKVASELEVDVDLIEKLINQGRLIEVKPTWSSKCRQCGAPISSGDLCGECRSELAAELSKASKRPHREQPAEESRKKSAKIYLYDRVKSD